MMWTLSLTAGCRSRCRIEFEGVLKSKKEASDLLCFISVWPGFLTGPEHKHLSLAFLLTFSCASIDMKLDIIKIQQKKEREKKRQVRQT